MSIIQNMLNFFTRLYKAIFGLPPDEWYENEIENCENDIDSDDIDSDDIDSDDIDSDNIEQLDNTTQVNNAMRLVNGLLSGQYNSSNNYDVNDDSDYYDSNDDNNESDTKQSNERDPSKAFSLVAGPNSNEDAHKKAVNNFSIHVSVGIDKVTGRMAIACGWDKNLTEREAILFGQILFKLDSGRLKTNISDTFISIGNVYPSEIPLITNILMTWNKYISTYEQKPLVPPDAVFSTGQPKDE